MLEGFCFADFFFAFFSRGHTLQVFHLCLVPMLLSFLIFVVSLRVCLSACSFFVGKMETCRVKPRGKKGKKKQRSRILQAYENKISYTPEDGHVGRNM
jgi:hypothetical protein